MPILHHTLLIHSMVSLNPIKPQEPLNHLVGLTLHDPISLKFSILLLIVPF